VCTLTWLHEAGGYQIFFNRDERRERKPAEPPATRRQGSTRFVAPIDGDFGGCWIAVNEHGLSLALLNGYADGDLAEPPAGFTSRGLLVTSLIDSRSLDQLGRTIRARPLQRFRSFQLLALTPGGGSYLADWRGGELRERRALVPPLLLSSSSYRREEVLRSRAEQFERLARVGSEARAELHLAFHESHLPERGPRSPCMHRDDARTVSLSWIRVDGAVVCMRYAPHSPCRGRPDPTPVCLARSETRS